jgi:hypothetical protein
MRTRTTARIRDLALDPPDIAVVAPCMVYAIGLVLTLVHTWQKPPEEPALSYLLIAIAGEGCSVCRCLRHMGRDRRGHPL